MGEDIVKIKCKATAELVADGIKKAIKPSDVKKEAQQRAKAMQSAMDSQKIEIPAEIIPDTSKLDKAKKEAEKPIKKPVKLEMEKVDLPLLGKTPMSVKISDDSQKAIKDTLSAAEKTSKNLIDAAKEVVKKIGSANYLEELNSNERQAISTAVSKVKRSHPEISDDRLKAFQQNLILDRRAKKTHDTLSESFRLPDSSSKSYGQEMYDAAITAAKIQAAVKIREGLHKDEGYTQFLSENDKKKNFNGSTLKLPDKIIDQIQNGLYEHLGVTELGNTLASGDSWTGIQDRLTQSIDSFTKGLSATIDASSEKRVTKEFQARIDSAVKAAVGMSVDNAISYLSGTKGTKESKKALSLLDRKKDGEYEYSINDIYDILIDRAPTGKNATYGEDAISGVNYKGFSDLLAAIQVYQRSGSSKLGKDHVGRLSKLVDEIVGNFQNSTYNAKTIIDSISASLDQAQAEAEKAANEQPKIEEPKKTEESKEEKEPITSTPNKSDRKVVKPSKILKSNSQARDVNGNLLSWNGQDWVIQGTQNTGTSSSATPTSNNPPSLPRIPNDVSGLKQNIDSIISQYNSYMKGIRQIESKTKDLRRVKKTGNEDVAKSIQTELDGLKETFSGAEDFVKKHENTLGKDRVNAYKTKQSKIKSEEQGILDDHQSAIDQKDFADSYTAAISKVNELKQAYSDLFKIQTKGANGELTGSELKSQIEGQTRLISKLKNETTDFWDQVYSKNKNNPDSILNDKLFSAYEKAFADTQDYSNFNGDKNNIIALMQKAYQNQRDTQISALKAASKGDAYGIEKNKALSNNYKNAYESIRAQVVAQFGKDVANNALNGIKSDANNRQTVESGNAYSSLIKQIDAYVASVEKAGKASSAFREHFENLKNGLTDSKSNFDKSRNHQGMLEFIDKISDSKFSFDNLKDYYKSGFGSSELDFTERMNKLTGSGDSSNKIDSYFTKIDKFQNRYNDIIDQLNNKQIDTKTAKSGIKEIVSEMDDLIKVSDKYNKVTNKGEYIDGTAGSIHNWKDVSNALDSYAKSLNAVEVGTAKINEATGQVTKTYKVNGDDIITLTGNIEKYGDALRMIQKLQSGSGSGGSGSLLGGLKNLVSGNFKSIVGEIGNSVANVQILGQAFQQMKDGFNTFLDFNKGLTNISYTMDMSKEQLSSLGSSAVDMAKDLSMSLDNTMDIYQIYANMNTTSKEIQETAKPTAILSNLSGVDASTAADQVQGILQQFHMLEDGSTTAADASMHVVDVLDKISGNIGMDYAKGIKVISDAVQASGQVAYDAGMSYEQLAAVSAKVAERTREDGSSIGNAMKTIITRISKVGSMPEYAADVSNEDLSQASESLHKVGVEVYNTDGSFRDLDTILSELNAKWDGLTDAQKANISYNVAATRQTSKFKNILEAWTDSMNLANEATTTSGNAEANQEKYMESFSGKIQSIKTQMDEFWLNFYNSDQVSGALDFVQGLTEGFTGLEEAIGPIPTLITAVFSALTVKNAAAKGLEFLVGKDGQASGLANAVG